MAFLRPPLNALRAFEVTVRLGSMTAAARELGVTHGAISRHIRLLEEGYGLPLLVREGISLTPTSEGARLAEGLTTAFSVIETSLDHLRPLPLTLSCSATITMHWLIPRLARFHALHPKIHVQLNTGYNSVDFVRDKITIAIRTDAIAPPRDVIVHELMEEWVGPVCAPQFRRTRKLTSLEALERLPLLGTRTRPDAWRDWLRSVGHAAASDSEQEMYEHFYLLIQAALFGRGVALVPEMLVMSEIEAGRLVAPFGFRPGGRRVVLWVAPYFASRADTKALTAWLGREMLEP